MAESLSKHDLDFLFQTSSSPFPALPLYLEPVSLPSQLPNPTQPGLFAYTKAASWSLICGSVPKLKRTFSIVYYLAVLHYAFEGAETWRHQQSKMTREEWYAVSDEFIHEGHDRALLYFYPPRGAGRGPRFRPPARGRVEAWCRTAMDSHLRRMDAVPIISQVRLPFVADLGPSGDEVIAWRTEEGMRAITLSMNRGEWGWYPVPRARPRRRVGSSCPSGEHWSGTDTGSQLSTESPQL